MSHDIEGLTPLALAKFAAETRAAIDKQVALHEQLMDYKRMYGGTRAVLAGLNDR